MTGGSGGCRVVTGGLTVHDKVRGQDMTEQRKRNRESNLESRVDHTSQIFRTAHTSTHFHTCTKYMSRCPKLCTMYSSWSFQGSSNCWGADCTAVAEAKGATLASARRRPVRNLSEMYALSRALGTTGGWSMWVCAKQCSWSCPSPLASSYED